MHIVVTGGAGFIGSNLVRKLNQLEHENITIVENTNSLERNGKFRNLSDLVFKDIVDYSMGWGHADVVVHLGARSDTRGVPEKLWKMNFEFTRDIVEFDRMSDSKRRWDRLIYASSAAVYGDVHEPSHEVDIMDPLNFYGFTKAAVDRLVMSKKDPHIVGLRFFNVYGPNEDHKKNNISIIGKFVREAKQTGEINVFAPDTCRDFIHVDDVCDAIVAAMDEKHAGIYNVGTGIATNVMKLAKAVQDRHTGSSIRSAAAIPSELAGRYQRYTCASTAKLETLLPGHKFKTIDQGIEEYLR